MARWWNTGSTSVRCWAAPSRARNSGNASRAAGFATVRSSAACAKVTPTWRTVARKPGSGGCASRCCDGRGVRAPAHPLRLVAEIRPQPALRFFKREPLAARVILDLRAVDLADREVARLRMGDVPAAHRRGRVHGVGFGEADAGAALDGEQAPELGLLGVIRARRVPGSRADATILLAHQLLVGERLGGGVTPQLAPPPLVEMLGRGFGQAIGQRLQHDARVVIVGAREARQVLFDPYAGGDGER